MLRTQNGIRAASLAAPMLVLLAACSSPGEPEPAGAPVAIVSADTLRAGEVAAPLRDSLVVKVTDAKGKEVPRQPVEWISPLPGGQVSPVQTVTDDGGFAGTAWTLGQSAGSQVVVARTVTTEGPKTVRFTAVVEPGPLAGLTISGSMQLAVEQERQITLTRRDAYGNLITGRPVAWISSDTTVARVNATGLVRGVAPGTAQVTVATEGMKMDMAVTVLAAASFSAFDTERRGTVGAAVRGVTGNGTVGLQFRAEAAAGTVSTVAVSPASVLLGAGQSRQLSAVASDAYGNLLAGIAVAWSSSNPAVATVDPQSGLVRAVAPGSATITAAIGGKTGTASVVVDPVVLLDDDFDAENDGRPADDYAAFANWDVAAGSVDLVGTGLYDDFLPPENGVGVDLDGTTRQAGTLRTITRSVTVPARTTARLEFAHLGGDNYGILLDDVKLVRRP